MIDARRRCPLWAAAALRLWGAGTADSACAAYSGERVVMRYGGELLASEGGYCAWDVALGSGIGQGVPLREDTVPCPYGSV